MFDLKTAEMQLRTEIEKTSPTTHIIVDKEGIIKKIVNGVLFPVLDYSWKYDAIGISIHDFLSPFFVDGISKEDHKKWFDAWIKKPTAKTFKSRGAFTLKSLSGNRVQVVVSIDKFEVDNGIMVDYDSEGIPFQGAIAHVTAWPFDE